MSRALLQRFVSRCTMLSEAPMAREAPRAASERQRAAGAVAGAVPRERERQPP